VRAMRYDNKKDHLVTCPHPNPLPKGEGTEATNPLQKGEGTEAINPLPKGEGTERRKTGKPPAVVLLSGGLDSATTAAIARDRGYELHALSVDYGQRHRWELAAARRVAESLGVREHKVLKVDLAQLGHSALTDAIAVPKDRPVESLADEIPVTYVPARNTVLLALALAYAETIGAADIFLGVNAVDYSGYPDCRPEFLSAFERVANLATKAGVEGQLKFRLHAPLLEMSKAEIIRRGVELGVDYSLTHSCYDPTPEGISCGHCDACQLRLQGFAAAGLTDPLRYAESSSGQWPVASGLCESTSGNCPFPKP
jgi:7-cyano-7-deazaguanine synthase